MLVWTEDEPAINYEFSSFDADRLAQGTHKAVLIYECFRLAADDLELLSSSRARAPAVQEAQALVKSRPPLSGWRTDANTQDKCSDSLTSLTGACCAGMVRVHMQVRPAGGRRPPARRPPQSAPPSLAAHGAARSPYKGVSLCGQVPACGKTSAVFGQRLTFGVFGLALGDLSGPSTVRCVAALWAAAGAAQRSSCAPRTIELVRTGGAGFSASRCGQTLRRLRCAHISAIVCCNARHAHGTRPWRTRRRELRSGTYASLTPGACTAPRRRLQPAGAHQHRRWQPRPAAAVDGGCQSRGCSCLLRRKLGDAGRLPPSPARQPMTSRRAPRLVISTRPRTGPAGRTTRAGVMLQQAQLPTTAIFRVRRATAPVSSTSCACVLEVTASADCAASLRRFALCGVRNFDGKKLNGTLSASLGVLTGLTYLCVHAV